MLTCSHMHIQHTCNPMQCLHSYTHLILQFQLQWFVFLKWCHNETVVCCHKDGECFCTIHCVVCSADHNVLMCGGCAVVWSPLSHPSLHLHTTTARYNQEQAGCSQPHLLAVFDNVWNGELPCFPVETGGVSSIFTFSESTRIFLAELIRPCKQRSSLTVCSKDLI